MTTIESSKVTEVGRFLKDKKCPLKERFRALFTLKNVGGKEAIDIISSCFDDDSALLKHELAYCMGQMQDDYAIPSLVTVLEDKSQEPMVRHEAGEALGAIGSTTVLHVLEKYCNDPVIEVAETCQLAVQRLKWLENPEVNQLSTNPYNSVDPAPPSKHTDITTLKNTLLDEQLPLFQRYRAMFTLRNMGSDESVLALAEALNCSSALLRHEIAYVLGQIQSDVCVEQLAKNLSDKCENPMVRHECAEALGSIATKRCMEILENYSMDNERVVKESCFVALDMSEYENSGQFQYADGLGRIEK